MTSADFDHFLSYGAWVCLAMAGLNTILVFRRGRTWAMPIACVFMALALYLYESRVSPLLWGFAGFGVVVALCADMMSRMGRPKGDAKR